MDAKVLEVVGQVAGIGGLALGAFLLLFRDLIRKNIFPMLPSRDAYRLLRLITGAVWSVAIVGIAAWLYVQTRPATMAPPGAKAATGIANTGTQTFNAPITIGGPSSSATER